MWLEAQMESMKGSFEYSAEVIVEPVNSLLSQGLLDGIYVQRNWPSRVLVAHTNSYSCNIQNVNNIGIDRIEIVNGCAKTDFEVFYSWRCL